MGSAHDDTAQEGQTKVNIAKHILILCFNGTVIHYKCSKLEGLSEICIEYSLLLLTGPS